MENWMNYGRQRKSGLLMAKNEKSELVNEYKLVKQIV